MFKKIFKELLLDLIEKNEDKIDSAIGAFLKMALKGLGFIIIFIFAFIFVENIDDILIYLYKPFMWTLIVGITISFIYLFYENHDVEVSSENFEKLRKTNEQTSTGSDKVHSKMYFNGSEIIFRLYSGEAISVNNKLESNDSVDNHLRGRGDENSEVKSENSSEVNEILVEVTSGEEKCFKLNNWTVPVKKGDTVTVATASLPEVLKDEASSSVPNKLLTEKPLLVINHAKKEYWTGWSIEDINQLCIPDTNWLLFYVFFPLYIVFSQLLQFFGMTKKAIWNSFNVALGLVEIQLFWLILNNSSPMLVLIFFYLLGCIYYPYHIRKLRRDTDNMLNTHLKDIGTKFLEKM